MGESCTVDRPYLVERFERVRKRIRDERCRTITERRAFESFADRIQQLDIKSVNQTTADNLTANAIAGNAATSQLPARTTDESGPTAAVRHAYEETVMSVPFYDDEYGDCYEQSIKAELGPEVATAVTQPQCFGPAAKHALYAAIQRAVAERAHLIETCTYERESIDTAADTLVPLITEVDRLATKSIDNESFGALEARWQRLDTLCCQCNDAAKTRQQDIKQLRNRFNHPDGIPNFCMYLYQDLGAEYPILGVCGDIAARLRTLQNQYEQAMATH